MDTTCTRTEKGCKLSIIYFVSDDISRPLISGGLTVQMQGAQLIRRITHVRVPQPRWELRMSGNHLLMLISCYTAFAFVTLHTVCVFVFVCVCVSMLIPTQECMFSC